MANFSSTYPSTKPVFQFNADAGRIDPRATFSRSDTAPLGNWNAETNSPSLSDGTGTGGDYYRVSVSAWQDTGDGAKQYFKDQYVKYIGGKWEPTAYPIDVYYWSNEKHLSSENLFVQSSDFDVTWYNQGLSAKTGGQTDPSGGTDGFTLVEDGAAAFHRLSQSPTATGELALTVYAKRNSGTRYLNLTFGSSGGGSLGSALATFDLAGGATHTANGSNSTLTNLSATQTASGNGYYKCVFKATASASITTAQISLSNTATPAANNYGLVYYTGDNSSSLDIAFASLTSNGATDYQPTTTQIHRAYAPTLKSVSYAGQPRFEYDPTDGESAGTSLGILVEGQAQNLVPYSQTLSSWSANVGFTVTDSAAVGPDGTLSASLLTPNTTNALHFLQDSVTTVASTTYTMSAYVKPVGYTNFRLSHFQSASPYTGTTGDYSLTGDGTATSADGTATITKLQDGWYRVTLTAAATSTTTILRVYGMSPDPAVASFTPNEYSGILCTGVQFEANSFASSYIKSDSGSATTRAADSLSVATADIGYTGGPVTIVAETEAGAGLGNAPRLFNLNDGSDTTRLMVYKDSTAANNTVAWTGYYGAAAMGTLAGSNNSSKVAVSVDTNDFAATSDTGTLLTNASGSQHSFTHLYLGSNYNGTAHHLNGHIKRLALFGEALSDSNIQSLTK